MARSLVIEKFTRNLLTQNSKNIIGASNVCAYSGIGCYSWSELHIANQIQPDDLVLHTQILNFVLKVLKELFRWRYTVL